MTNPKPNILVRKLDAQGNETWRYSGVVLQRGANFVRLEARFNRDDLPFHGIVLKRDDRFLETFYTDRWYNIFEIHDRDDDTLKCWYCNVGFPAQLENNTVSYRDLALDLLVFPDGTQLRLDEDEFATLTLSTAERRLALLALEELSRLFMDRISP